MRRYHDPYINYFEKGIRRIPYFKNISREIMIDMIFKMKEVFHEKNKIIIKRSEEANNIMFIKHGCVEVYMLIDGMEFIIDLLFDGSVINYRHIIIEDFSFVYMRAKTNV